MANTKYLAFQRPTVGSSYDKNDPNFTPGSDVDILDEIDRRVADHISWLYFDSGRRSIGTAPTNIALDSRDGAYAVAGTEVYSLDSLSPLGAGALQTLTFVTDNHDSYPRRVVAVGLGGFVTVYNFSGWTTPTSGVTDDLYAVLAVGSPTWATATIIAAGANGAAIKSTDAGSTWTNITSSFATANHQVSFGAVGGVNMDTMAFVAANTVTNTIDIIYTQDGSTFTSASTSITYYGSTAQIIWDGEYWVVAAEGYLAWSPDLTSWSYIDLSLEDPNYYGNLGSRIARLGSLYFMTTWDLQYGFAGSSYIFSRYDLLNSSTFTFVNPSDLYSSLGPPLDRSLHDSVYYTIDGDSNLYKSGRLLQW